MNRPRVTATHESENVVTRNWSGESTTSPDVWITVSFDLYDHRLALIRFERAVEDVRAQITQTARAQHNPADA